MKNSKNKQRTTALITILLGLLVIGFKVMFMSSDSDLLSDENTAASARVESIMNEVKSINFDTSVMKDPKFMSLKSIEIPLPSLPIGKKNPFLP